MNDEIDGCREVKVLEQLLPAEMQLEIGDLVILNEVYVVYKGGIEIISRAVVQGETNAMEDIIRADPYVPPKSTGDIVVGKTSEDEMTFLYEALAGCDVPGVIIPNDALRVNGDGELYFPEDAAGVKRVLYKFVQPDADGETDLVGFLKYRNAVSLVKSANLLIC